jgi:hypothetical protein
MINISGFSLSAICVASNTFPSGVSLSAFADDTDPMDSPDFTAADTAMGLNGDLVVWTRPGGIEMVFGIIPNSEDDINLEALLNANRVGKSKSGSQDIISIVLNYPNGKKVTGSNGVITQGPLMPSVASSGRLKSRVYRFRFESVTQG